MATAEQHSDLSSNYHSANVACYLRDINTGKVYGLTNKHVTLNAEQIYIRQTDQHEQIKLGTSFKSFEDVHLDVGLIRIDQNNEVRLKNKEKPNHQVHIYPDLFKSIFCKEVIKYKPDGTHYEICKYDTSNCGVIASESEHKQFEVKDGQFLVKSTSGDFAVNGESGTVIAVKTGKAGETELIGMICGGLKCYTVCLFFPFILQYLKEQFGFILQLFEPELYDEDFESKEKQSSCVHASKQVDRISAKTCIPSGLKIYFICPTPEQIAPMEFDLVKRALNLLCMAFTPVNLNNYELLVTRENHLSLLVSERGNFSENAIFENKKSEFVAIEMDIRACDCLYIGMAAPAEKNLKKAISCVLKSGDLGLRLLCKLVTYITWYCLVQNSSESLYELKNLLNEAIDIFESDFRKQNGFPMESLGYMYYDFSRYYMTKWENKRRIIHDEGSFTCTKHYRTKAIDKVKQAVAIFEDEYYNKRTPESARRLVLAKCQTIYSLLGCGDRFDPSEVITNEEIKEAEEILKSIHSEMTKMPTVQNLYYLLALCDLQFRKGYLQTALDTARLCLKLSKNKRHKVALERSMYRVETLSKLLRMS